MGLILISIAFHEEDALGALGIYLFSCSSTSSGHLENGACQSEFLVFLLRCIYGETAGSLLALYGPV